MARRTRRAVGNVLLALGLGVLIWTFVVWQWNDPFTSLYTRWQQHKLTAAHELIVEHYRPKRPIPVSATQEEAAAIAKDARRLRTGAAKGAPVGRIIVPRLHLNMLMVNGTDHESLKRGRDATSGRTCRARGSSSTSPATARRIWRRSPPSTRCSRATGSPS